ncbi:MFS transporter [Streptomyces roseoverticillatus]|uniref:MFS transporter n=1 Tax=Streptomyces roseoverticillatus TaxID=66429 RepID=A0ABV3IV43_9ACTN
MINAINAAGNGLVLPLLVVYLHEMRGLSLAVATSAIAATSLGALVGAPLAGWASDRFGRVHAVWAALVCAAVGSLGYALCETPYTALAAGLAQGLGIGGAITWNALIADLVPKAHWSVLFSADFAVTNAVMGLGGLIGGLLAGLTHSLVVFQVLFVLDAVSFLTTGWLVSRELRGGRQASAGGPGAEPASADEEKPSSGYLGVLRNRWFVGLLLAVFALYTIGYSQLNSGMPAMLLVGSRFGTTQLGVLYAVNTAAVVTVQFALLGRIRDFTPRIALTLLAGSWAAFWLLILAVTGLGRGWFALSVGAAAMVVFAAGESLLAATGPTLVNSWADKSNRGRFNAAYGFASSLGFTVGPLLSGRLTQGGHGSGMVLGFCLALALLGLVLFCTRLLPSTSLSKLENRPPAAEQPAEV